MSAFARTPIPAREVRERVRLLVADDDELFCATIADLLGEAGYLIDTVSGGSDAIAQLRRVPYALLISDVHMPGNEALQLLQATGSEWPNMPVIIVSGIPDRWAAAARTDRHVIATLLKPFSARALLTVVERALSIAVPFASPTLRSPASQPVVQ